MALDLSRVRGLCFDVDGTLRDTDDQYVERLAGYLNVLRPVLPRRDTRLIARRVIMAVEDPGNLALDLADRLHIDNLTARLLQGLSRPRLRKAAIHPAIMGVNEMLAALDRRYPLAIISTRDERSTLEFLEGQALAGLFQVIVTGQTCQRTKPHPMPVRWAANQMGITAESCLMIGDTTVDIRAGLAAGAQTVGVLCGFGTQGELLKAGAHLLLESTADLAGYLLKPDPGL
jgi:HAD superfamily hydrolase (TIGR01549 family)